MLCNTEKGADAFAAVKNDLECGESCFEKVLPGNPSLTNSVQGHFRRDGFMKDLRSGMEIDKLMDEYDFRPSFVCRLRGEYSLA